MGRPLPARKVIGIAGMALAPLAIHAAIVSNVWPPLVVAIPLVQLLVLGLVGVFRDPRRARWVVPLAVLLTGGTAWAARSGIDLNAMAGLPHALAYSALLFGFGYSLMPGREAVLTRVVQAARGPLPPELVAHTRRVTFAWCCFFAAQLLASLLLYLLAPIEVWSFFINVLNLPLILLMFLAELVYRFVRFRHVPMESLPDMIRLAAKAARTCRQQVDRA